MKPRIEKKLSKKALAILAASERREFQQTSDRAWIDDDFETDYIALFSRAESGKAERLHRQGRVRVNHVPSIGGEYDSYLGEASDHFTLYRWAQDYVDMSSRDFISARVDEYRWPESSIKGRLTGKKVIEELRSAAREVLA